MGAFLELLKRPGRTSVIWLDSHNYTGRLLAGGAPPWLDVAAFVAWQRKAQGLLKSNVASLPVAPVAQLGWKRTRTCASAMGAKTRSVYPLKDPAGGREVAGALGRDGARHARGPRRLACARLAVAARLGRAGLSAGAWRRSGGRRGRGRFRVGLYGRLPARLRRGWVRRGVTAGGLRGPAQQGRGLARLPGRLQRRCPLQMGCRLATSGSHSAFRRRASRSGVRGRCGYGARRPAARDRSQSRVLERS